MFNSLSRMTQMLWVSKRKSDKKSSSNSKLFITAKSLFILTTLMNAKRRYRCDGDGVSEECDLLCCFCCWLKRKDSSLLDSMSKLMLCRKQDFDVFGTSLRLFSFFTPAPWRLPQQPLWRTRRSTWGESRPRSDVSKVPKDTGIFCILAVWIRWNLLFSVWNSLGRHFIHWSTNSSFVFHKQKTFLRWFCSHQKGLVLLNFN